MPTAIVYLSTPSFHRTFFQSPIVDDSLKETLDSALGKYQRSGNYLQLAAPCENASPISQSRLTFLVRDKFPPPGPTPKDMLPQHQNFRRFRRPCLGYHHSHWSLHASLSCIFVPEGKERCYSIGGISLPSKISQKSGWIASLVQAMDYTLL